MAGSQLSFTLNVLSNNLESAMAAQSAEFGRRLNLCLGGRFIDALVVALASKYRLFYIGITIIIQSLVTVPAHKSMVLAKVVMSDLFIKPNNKFIYHIPLPR